MIIGLTWAGVSTPELPEVCQPLAPLLHLLVAVVVLPRLLGEVGEHGSQRPPTHVVRPSLAPLIATDSRELSNRLNTIHIELSFIWGHS